MPLKKNQWVCGNCFRVNRTDFNRCYDCGISREESRNRIRETNKAEEVDDGFLEQEKEGWEV